MNKAILIGNLGSDPELKTAASGTSVASFSLATTESYKGEKKTEWHRITVFGKLAEICGKYLVKGSKIALEGRIETQKWEDRDGNKRQTTVIIGLNVEFLSQKHESNNGHQTQAGDDDVPF